MLVLYVLLFATCSRFYCFLCLRHVGILAWWGQIEQNSPYFGSQKQQQAKSEGGAKLERVSVQYSFIQGGTYVS